MPQCLNQNNNNQCTSCSEDNGVTDGNVLVESRVRTYNAEFTNQWGALPGNYLVNPNPQMCDQQCQDIHNNVIRVSRFIETQLESNQQLPLYTSSINTWFEKNGYFLRAGWWINEPDQENETQAFYQSQAFYGQRNISEHQNNRWCSYGTDITIVAHEFCHGLIHQARGCKLSENQLQENAVEESLCDIFAILVRNFQPDQNTWLEDIRNWQWCVGEDFETVGQPLRCLDTRMARGREIERNTRMYHDLSLFHSHVFYTFMTTPDEYGGYLFNGEFALQLFRETLENLTVDTNFSKSQTNFVESAITLLEYDPLGNRKVQAIQDAFNTLH